MKNIKRIATLMSAGLFLFFTGCNPPENPQEQINAVRQQLQGEYREKFDAAITQIESTFQEAYQDMVAQRQLDEEKYFKFITAITQYKAAVHQDQNAIALLNQMLAHYVGQTALAIGQQPLPLQHSAFSNAQQFVGTYLNGNVQGQQAFSGVQQLIPGATCIQGQFGGC